MPNFYECESCGAIFNENDADTDYVDLEDEYGVGGLFPDHHTTLVLVCPECGCNELNPVDHDEEVEDENT